MHWEEEEAKEDFSIKASFHLLHWSIFTFYVKGIFQWNDQTRHTQESDTFKWEKEKKIGMKAVVYSVVIGVRTKMKKEECFSYLRGSDSVPSFGRLFGLLARGQPDKLLWVA